MNTPIAAPDGTTDYGLDTEVDINKETPHFVEVQEVLTVTNPLINRFYKERLGQLEAENAELVKKNVLLQRMYQTMCEKFGVIANPNLHPTRFSPKGPDYKRAQKQPTSRNVEMVDPTTGELVVTFISVEQACEILQRCKRRVCEALNKGIKCAGHYLRYSQ